MAKLLVTGGAGFIGSNFIYYQLEHHPEDQILCLDSLTYAGNIATLRGAMERPAMGFVPVSYTHLTLPTNSRV